MGSTKSAAVEDRFDRVAYFADRSHAVDARNDAPRFIDREDRSGLGAILGHAGAHGLRIVIGTALELIAAADIAQAGDLRELMAIVIALAALAAGKAAADAIDQGLFVDGELDHMVEMPPALVEQLIERRGLGLSARIAVENDAAGRVRLVQAMLVKARGTAITSWLG